MRSEGNDAVVDCDDPMTVIACTTNTSACPAACKEAAGDDTDVVVKSGDLEISASSSSSQRAIIGNVSDLDTINFKASEAITLNSITLERYGYSEDADVAAIWLENSNGEKVANEKTLNSKGQVTLNITKDYRELSKNDVLTVVVELEPEDCGQEQNCTPISATNGTIGFKVIEVNASAKTVDIEDYKPYTYNYVSYNGTHITINVKDKERTYHYADGDSYVVSQFQVKADTSSVRVNGFTLANNGTMKFDRYAGDITVTVDWKKVSGLTTKIDRDDLVISFNDVEIPAKQKVLFKVETTLSNLDDLGKTLRFDLEEKEDFKATEVKNNARVDLETFVGYEYTFKWGKVTLTNNKLSSTVDGSQWAEGIVIWDGKIEVPEAIRLNTFTVSAGEGLSAMTMIVNWEDYDGKPVADGFQFKGVEIAKSGTIKFTVDVDDEAELGATINVDSTFARALLINADEEVGEYDDSGEPLFGKEFVGSISLSNVKVQKARGSLENNKTSDVEFVTSESNRKVVFDGTFTANKQDVYLDTVMISQSIAADLDEDETITFYVFIDGQEVTSVDFEADDDDIDEIFDEVLVEKWTSVKVKVEADVYATTAVDHKYTVSLKGQDKDNNETEYVSDDTGKMSFVANGSVIITDSTAGKNNVALAEANMKLATFVVKPANEDDDGITMTKAEMTLDIPVEITKNDIKVKVDGVDLFVDDNFTYDAEEGTLALVDLSEDLGKAGVAVEVSLKWDVAKWNYGNYILTLSKVNDTSVTKTFKRYVVPALVKVSQQENLGDETRYTFSVTKEDKNFTVEAFEMWYGSTPAISMDDVTSGDTDDTTNLSNVTYIDYVEYVVKDANGEELMSVSIDKTNYKDYFKVWSEYVKVYKSKD